MSKQLKLSCRSVSQVLLHRLRLRLRTVIGRGAPLDNSLKALRNEPVRGPSKRGCPSTLIAAVAGSITTAPLCAGVSVVVVT
jgi:hypothetical protein